MGGSWGERQLRENILEFLLGQVSLVGLNATEARHELTKMYDYFEGQVLDMHMYMCTYICTYVYACFYLLY